VSIRSYHQPQDESKKIKVTLKLKRKKTRSLNFGELIKKFKLIHWRAPKPSYRFKISQRQFIRYCFKDVQIHPLGNGDKGWSKIHIDHQFYQWVVRANILITYY